MLSLVSVNQGYNRRDYIGDAIERAMLKGTEDLQLINVDVVSDDGVFGLLENCSGEESIRGVTHPGCESFGNQQRLIVP